MSWVKGWMPGENERYRRKVIDVPAFRFGHENEPPWYFEAVENGEISRHGNKLSIRYGERLLKTAEKIQSIHHDVFIDLYEPVPKPDVRPSR
jgi:hypothetical protein